MFALVPVAPATVEEGEDDRRQLAIVLPNQIGEGTEAKSTISPNQEVPINEDGKRRVSDRGDVMIPDCFIGTQEKEEMARKGSGPKTVGPDERHEVEILKGPISSTGAEPATEWEAPGQIIILTTDAGQKADEEDSDNLPPKSVSDKTRTSPYGLPSTSRPLPASELRQLGNECENPKSVMPVSCAHARNHANKILRNPRAMYRSSPMKTCSVSVPLPSSNIKEVEEEDEDEERRIYNNWLKDYQEKVMWGYNQKLKMNQARIVECLNQVKALEKAKNRSEALLQETKLQNISQAMARYVWHKRRPQWVEVGAQGSARGIAVFWDPNEVELIAKEEGMNGSHWAALSVYGPTSQDQREDFWHELSALIQLWPFPWIIGGDFNVTRYNSENLGGRCRVTSAMTQFNSLIQDLSLIQPSLGGGQYTWSNRRSSQLDRFLVTQGWLDLHKNVSGRVLPRLTSDHNPIMLETEPDSWGVPPFCFEDGWLLEDGFKEKLKTRWEDCDAHGKACLRFSKKLKSLKNKIRAWAKERNIDFDKEKAELLDKIQEFDRIEELNGSLSILEGIERDLFTKAYEDKVAQERIYWKQRARNIVRPFPSDLPLKSLPPTVRELLEKPFTVEEIEERIRSLPSDKVPSLGGFTAEFYKQG
ncbi:hypothetical protein H6P81_013888 [Aristolochia fimbriata]|uniref:Endonuclease/exonuclease/phosphatase domain-containing protein n=1 Tax=Aristolochia fimbriata TaxID=158543 RepID=A0AAV7EI47_ARIFI|nr:hypothetical protein H6P81_013888 [Aristolochia fimbriata]